MSTQYPNPYPTPYPPQDTTAFPEQQSRGVSIPHLVLGLVFLGLAGLWLLQEAGVIESVEVQWLLPLILVAAGAAGLLASITRTVMRRPRRPSAPAQDRTEVVDDTP